MSARDALNAYVAHFSDADQAEYEKRLDAYADEIPEHGNPDVLALPKITPTKETTR